MRILSSKNMELVSRAPTAILIGRDSVISGSGEKLVTARVSAGRDES